MRCKNVIIAVMSMSVFFSCATEKSMAGVFVRDDMREDQSVQTITLALEKDGSALLVLTDVQKKEHRYPGAWKREKQHIIIDYMVKKPSTVLTINTDGSLSFLNEKGYPLKRIR